MPVREETGNVNGRNSARESIGLPSAVAENWIRRGVSTATNGTQALYDLNLISEYPNLARSLIFAPSFAALDGAFAGITVAAHHAINGDVETA